MNTVLSFSSRIIRISFMLLFILVPIILTPWNYELFEYNKMMTTYMLTAVILGAWLVKMIAGNAIRIKRTPLDIPIFLFVLSQFVSTIFSMDPHISWLGYYSRFNGGMLSVLTYVALYYAFVSTFENLSFRLIQIMLLTGCVVALYGVAEHFGIDKHLWVQDVQNRVFSTLGQPNWLAAYLIALTPIAMALGLKSEIRNPKSEINSNNKNTNAKNLFTPLNLNIVWNLKFVIWSFISVLFFLTLLWTRSRSGLMAFVIVDIIFWVFAFTKSHLVKGSFVLIHAAFFLIIVLNGTYIDKIDTWITARAWTTRIVRLTRNQTEPIKPATASAEKINSNTEPQAPLIESGITDSGDIRKYVWEGAINAWRTNAKTFLIGTGTETFAFAFYASKPIGHNLTSEWDFLYNKAHNEYLNFLATTGTLGLGTYLVFIGSFIWWFIKNKIRSTKYEARISNFISIGLFSGWISILITNFFGFSVVIMQLLFYLIPAMMFALHAYEESRRDAETPKHPYRTFSLQWSPKQKKIAILGVSTVTILLIGTVILTWFSDKQFARGYNLSRSGYYPQAYQALAESIQLNPLEPMFHDEQGNVLSTLALASFKENQATISQELADAAIKENDIALSISPNNVNFWKSRTKIFYTLSSIHPTYLKDAILALEKGITLSPSDPKMYYNLAILYGQADTSDSPITYMKKAIKLKPNYREGYLGLSLLYKELDRLDESKQILKEYLQKVNPNDEEFQKMIQ